jgi:hypothetical protein
VFDWGGLSLISALTGERVKTGKTGSFCAFRPAVHPIATAQRHAMGLKARERIAPGCQSADCEEAPGQFWIWLERKSRLAGGSFHAKASAIA